MLYPNPTLSTLLNRGKFHCAISLYKGVKALGTSVRQLNTILALCQRMLL